MKDLFREKTTAERVLCSSALCESLKDNPHLAAAHCVMAYYPLKDEVDIRPLLDLMNERGKTVLLPEVVSDTEMVLRIYSPESRMVGSALGTSIPDGEIFTNIEDVDIVLAPGVAFDREGHRMGRGKGYYDRFLAQCTNAYKIGVCYPWQIVEKVPTDEHDIAMDCVIEI